MMNSIEQLARYNYSYEGEAIGAAIAIIVIVIFLAIAAILVWQFITTQNPKVIPAQECGVF